MEISSTNGSVVNQNTIGSINADNIRQLYFSPSNTIIITGATIQGVSGGKTDNGYGGFDLWMVEVDMSLNVLQDKCFGGSGSENMQGGSIDYIDGYYYITTASSSPISGNKTAPYMGNSGPFPAFDYWLIKIYQF